MDQRLLLMHQVMLGDASRLEAYERALSRAIRPGDTVLDVGAGMLILSLLALRHEARHVYAIEADPETAEIAQQIARANKLEGRLTIVQGDARTVQLPEKADVLVSEMMGNLGPEEEMAEIVSLAAQHNLREGGRIVPERLVTCLQAVEFNNEGWGVWSDDFWGYSLSTVRDYAASAAQLHFFSRDPTLLSAPLAVADNRLGRSAELPGGHHHLEITRAGTLHAVMGYFTATLAPEVTLSNFPSYPGSNWAVWIWPLRHTHVEPGDIVHVEINRPSEIRTVEAWTLNCGIARGCRR